MTDILIQGKQLITGRPKEKRQQNQFIAIKDGVFQAIGSGDGSQYIQDQTVVLKLEKDEIVVPGFIDLHIHGGYGVDVMDPEAHAISELKEQLPQEGTTSFLATTITQEQSAILNAIDRVVHNKNEAGAEVLGIHIEGPFINAKRKGAQPERFIQKPSIDLMNEWVKRAKGHIKQVTYAPELENGQAFTDYLVAQSINPSIGHSDADYAAVEQAVRRGLKQATHLFNGMRPLHHREPGVVGAAFLFDEIDVELIVDGVHIHPKTVKLAWKIKGTDRCLLITDSMRAKGLADGAYELGGQKVDVKEGKATLVEDGSLAGSILPMNEAVFNMIAFTGCSLEEAVQMASFNPAKKLGVLAKKGSIEIGKDADVTVLKEERVMRTFCKGVEQFRRKQLE